MEAVALRQRRPEPRHADRPPGTAPQGQLAEHGCRLRAAHGDDVEDELELGPRHERPPHQPDAPLRLELDARDRSEEHTSELQSPCNLVCRLLLEKKKKPHTFYGYSNVPQLNAATDIF